MSGLNETLHHYRKARNEYIGKKGKFLTVNVELTDKFLRTCEERIIAGHKKYGEDWKHKNCIKERDFEIYDLFNYTIFNICQKRFLKQ